MRLRFLARKTLRVAAARVDHGVARRPFLVMAKTAGAKKGGIARAGMAAGTATQGANRTQKRKNGKRGGSVGRRSEP